MRAVAALLAFVGLVAVRAAGAHGLDPALLSLRETAPGTFAVEWRSSALRLPGADVQPVLPASCRRTAVESPEMDGDRVILRWTIACDTPGMAGATIGVTDLAEAKINALVRIERVSGPVLETILGPRTPTLVVPEVFTRAQLLRDYVVLGVHHILSGPDHLLFVFGLVLLAGTGRRLVQTVTAFTLGHSISLSAAALRIAQVPSKPIEVLIALSVLLLAAELADDGRPRSLLRRWPALAAAAFGLLHGFGFAGALIEAGLPAGDVPLALLAFNVGIEIGQLAFVAAVLLVGAVAERIRPGIRTHAPRPAVYAMGVLAAFWTFERLAAWLG